MPNTSGTALHRDLLTLVCLPGALLTPAMFAPLHALEAHGITIKTFDYAETLRRKGQNFSVSAAAQALSTFLKSLGDTPYALLGHSLGGMIAQQAVSQALAQPTHLILMETSYGASAGPINGLLTTIARFVLNIMGWPRLRNQIISHHGSESDAARSYLAEALPTDRPPHNHHLILTEALTWNGKAKLPTINIPTLILVGEDNPQTHKQAQDMQRIIPNARLSTIPHAGHMCSLDNPGEVVEIVQEFLGVPTQDGDQPHA